ncbi:endonuclease domain-containing protein [Glacieibacterium frigidum]|uniref:Endonuclease domain-containing protein n=1 Tax=Glacieibacterium frigidum TaxID=2593303 RepID=A0A552UJ38_9SPHN|nr:DUF559 domain-containing protein [Glacieibacterium frigidum]TRW18191.1 endonuclease domain-containing protein [Glacieibacterium frigidum]
MSRVVRIVSPFAKPLRKTSTEAERKVWRALRDRRFAETKLRRQHSVGPYIADFACISAKLILELDGSQHNDSREYDARRTAYLNECGWRVVRFPNAEVFTNFDWVMQTIAWHLAAQTTEHPHPGPR